MRAEMRPFNINLLYLDLSACGWSQNTESTLEEAVEEVAWILETTGVEVVPNKIHVTSEEQAADASDRCC